MIDDARAASAIRRLGLRGGAWRPLGHGKEGIVVTDGEVVCKLFDGWRDEPVAAIERTVERIRAVVAGCSGASWLPLAARIDRVADLHTLWYRYEPSEPFNGGHERELCEMIRSLRRLGLMYYGFRASSFRHGSRGLLLVDLGIDVLPFEAPRWRHNLERAFLLARHGHRPDLKSLQHRALVGELVSELDEFPAFLRTCEEGL